MIDHILVKIFLGLLAWFVLGCVVLASADDDRQRLFKWARSAPFNLYVPAVMAWPIILWVWLRIWK